jgi:hypothetical protein
MTPEKKAKEIVFKYEKYLYGYFTTDEEYARCVECALIAVDEMQANAGMIWGGRNTETGLTARDEFRKYWQEVKKEIDKL